MLKTLGDTNERNSCSLRFNAVVYDSGGHDGDDHSINDGLNYR